MSHPPPNQNWIWSVEHSRFYRQELRDGHWITVWQPQAAVPAPINASTSPSPSHHQGLNSAPRNSGTQGRPDSGYGGSLPYNTFSSSSTYPSPYQAQPQEATSHAQPQAQQSAPPATYVLNTLSPQPPTTTQVSGRGQGLAVTGSYTPGRKHYEELDTTYFIQRRQFFREGKVFAVLFTEAAGSNITAYNTSISRVRFGQHVHTQIRRFIVVRTRNEFCYACPIFTYGGRGTTKPGVRPEEHAIAYTHGTMPELLPGEAGLRMQPICIVGAANTPSLDRESRIYFGIHHPIQYNVKVKDLGDVHSSHVPMLMGNWNMMNGTGTNQSIEVLNDDDDEDEDEDEEPPTVR